MKKLLLALLIGLGSVAATAMQLSGALALYELRPGSFRSTYQREVTARLHRPVSGNLLVTEDELSPLPPAVRTYLHRVGVVGQPHVRDYQVKWRGRMWLGPNERWMPMTADQHNFTEPPERFFLMRASMFGLPIEGFHRYAGGASTMQIRAVSLVDVGDARGPKMNESESVTLFNDMCAFAPATLIGAPVDWRETGERTVEGCFHHLGNRVCAELFFDEQGDLVNFVMTATSRATAPPTSRSAGRRRCPTTGRSALRGSPPTARRAGRSPRAPGPTGSSSWSSSTMGPSRRGGV